MGRGADRISRRKDGLRRDRAARAARGRCRGAGGLSHRAAELLPLPQRGTRGRTEIGIPWTGAFGAGAADSPDYFADLRARSEVKESAARRCRAIRGYDDATLHALDAPTSRLLSRPGETMTLRVAKIAAGVRRGDFLLVRRVQQHHGLRLELSICAARADDGFHVSRKSRHVARA